MIETRKAIERYTSSKQLFGHDVPDLLPKTSSQSVLTAALETATLYPRTHMISLHATSEDLRRFRPADRISAACRNSKQSECLNAAKPSIVGVPAVIDVLNTSSGERSSPGV
jgi:hypothetical protein